MRNLLGRVAIASFIVLAAAFLWVRRIDAPVANSRITTVPVVVANRDLPEGVIVDRVALVVAQWPAGTQPAGAFTAVDSVANRVTRVAVYKGEAIVPGRLAPEGTGAGLEVKITPGKRAYDIRINDVASLASIEVTPDESEKLAIAAAQGALQLVLRGYGDPDRIDNLPRPLVPNENRLSFDQCARLYQRGLVRDALRYNCGNGLKFQKDSVRRSPR